LVFRRLACRSQLLYQKDCISDLYNNQKATMVDALDNCIKESRRLEPTEESQVSCPPLEPVIRIATASSVAPTLQQYLNFYKTLHPNANQMIVESFSELSDLEREIHNNNNNLYQGFVTPAEGSPSTLLPLTDDLQESPLWRNVLPYYRHASVQNRAMRSLPLWSGHFYILITNPERLPQSPRTWSEAIRYAAQQKEEALGNCFGHLSLVDRLGMILASMNQVDGSETGWFLDTTPSSLSPLVNTEALVLLEQQELYDDGQGTESENIQRVQEGTCAMTIVAHHPVEALQNTEIHRLPGSHRYWNRQREELRECTSSTCPYAEEDSDWGRINRVPFGQMQSLWMGGTSNTASEEEWTQLQDFYTFVLSARLNVGNRDQPITYTGLQSYDDLPGYATILREMGESLNSAYPVRLPNSASWWTQVEEKLDTYLNQKQHSLEDRLAFQQDLEGVWNRRVIQQDVLLQKSSTAQIYRTSLEGGGSLINRGNVSTPADSYIGTTWRSVGWSLGGVSCLCSVLFAVWTWKYQHERVLKASQPKFLWMVCAGTFVMATSIFPFGIEDDIVTSSRGLNVSCMSAIWLYSFGYVATLMPLFAKIRRINQVRNANLVFPCLPEFPL